MSAERRRIRVVAAMIDREGRYLITQRRPTARLPLLWEFPGGRVEDGESDAAALARELKEEMRIEVRVGEEVLRSEHSYSDYELEFRVYRCTILSGEPEHVGVHDHRWVLPSELTQYKFPEADERTTRELLAL